MYLHTYRQTEDRQADRQTDTYVYVQIEREREMEGLQGM